jgi:hypothetical protein
VGAIIAAETTRQAVMRRISAGISMALALVASPVEAGDCVRANDDTAIAEGRLIERDDALILKLPQVMCLEGSEDSDKVPASAEIHVYAEDEDTQKALQALAGRDVHVRGPLMGALTQHHKAPIVMQVLEVDEL